MSTDYHRPTYTFDGDAYNATQVRLYGIPGEAMLAYQNSPAEFSPGDLALSIVPEAEADDEEFAKYDAELARLKELPPDEISRLWPIPIPLPTKYVHHLPIRTNMLGVVMIATSVGLAESKPLSTGVIFGYAYEGHCYDLPKPKLMFIPAIPRVIPDDDCGFDAKEDENYRVWIVDKLDQCAEIELNQGFVEQIVLEANLPGKRSPRSYSATMQLAHRSGRLTE